MRTILAHIIFLLTLPLFGQQNLVPNPSFEEVDNCSVMLPETPAAAWLVFNSSDYFNNYCFAAVPNTYLGHQYPKSGDAMFGITTYCPAINCGFDFREYIQAQLIEPLQSGRLYCISYNTVSADSVLYFSNNLNAYLSDTSLNFFGPNDPFAVNAQINKDANIIVDTINWQLIHRSIEAIGNEKFIILGNFSRNVDTDVSFNPGSNNSPSAYYYIDDVSVIELPEIDAGSNQTIFPYETAALSGNCEGCWNGLQYAWYPSVGLSDSTILNPTANPEITTTYYLTLIDTTGNVPCMSDVIDSVTVFVEPGPNLIVFPNPSTQNENVNYYVGKVEGSSISILLHDVKGKLIYEKENIISDSEYALDLRLAAGVYTLSLFSDSDLIETKKLVIEE